MKLRVGYSALALAQLEEMKRAREGTPRAKMYQTIRLLVEHVISNSDLVFAPFHFLTGDLKGVMRVKKGRARLFFAASKEKQLASVLYLGTRKEGDKRDAYEELRRLIRGGAFDPQFAELGIQKPNV